MVGILISLLAFFGLVYLGGAIWFFGDSGTYLGLAGGAAMLAWAGLWSFSQAKAICIPLLAVSVVSTLWLTVIRFISDSDVAVASLLIFFITLICAIVWVRKRILQW